MVHGWRVCQLLLVYECRSIIAVLWRTPQPPALIVGTMAVQWGETAGGKAFIPAERCWWPFLAGSVLLPLSRRANAGSFFSAGWSHGGGRRGGVRVQGRQAAVTPHTAFSGHGLYFWHVSTEITMMPPSSTSGWDGVVSSPHRANGLWDRWREGVQLLPLWEEGTGKDVQVCICTNVRRGSWSVFWCLCLLCSSGSCSLPAFPTVTCF